jgi:hypothetical protein
MAHAASAGALADERRFGGVRLLIGYAAVAVVLTAAVIVSVAIGHGLHAAPDVTGTFTGTASTCLGKSFSLAQSGRYVSIDGAGKTGGSLEINDGRVHGTVTCSAGGTAAVSLLVTKDGTALGGTVGGQTIHATRPATTEAAAAATTKKRRARRRSAG